MKITFITLISLFCFSILNGQTSESKNNSLRVGLNNSFFGAGDIIGPGVYAEYSRKLNNKLALTPRIMSAHAHSNSYGYYDHISSFATSLSIRITPMSKSFSRLKFDIGGLYHRFINSYGEIHDKDEYDQFISESSNHYERNFFGLFGSTNINIIEREKIIIGLRFDMLTSISSESFDCDSWQTGVYVGFDF